MIDENVNIDNEERGDSNRSSVGKIARLPNEIRELLNQRLLDGQPASVILPWLNDHWRVKEVLAAQFDGAPILRQNLDNWRQGGYQDWLNHEQSRLQFDRLAEGAEKISAGGRAAFARGAATIVSSQLFQLIDSNRSEKHNFDDFIKIISTLKPLLNVEQNSDRLKMANERIRQRERQLLLMRDKHQRDVVAIGLRLLGDERAKQIEAADINYAEQIELLGLHIFGDLWEPRPVTPYEEETPKPQP
jgi:hypothetical protein